MDAFADLTDEQVLATFLDTTRRPGERDAAFRELVDRFRRRIFAVCHRVLGSVPDAEDATQETFVKLARSAEDFRGEAKLSTWLFRVARNVCLDRIRYESRRPSTPVDDLTVVGTEPTVEDATDARLAAMDVRAALGHLDERSRQLLLLVAVDGLSYAEAAEVAGLPVGTVKSRVSRARVRLGELLADDGPARARPGTATLDVPAPGPGTTGGSGPRGPP